MQQSFFMFWTFLVKRILGTFACVYYNKCLSVLMETCILIFFFCRKTNTNPSLLFYLVCIKVSFNGIFHTLCKRDRHTFEEYSGSFCTHYFLMVSHELYKLFCLLLSTGQIYMKDNV